MRAITIGIGLLAALVAGCVSAKTQRELDRANERVAELSTRAERLEGQLSAAEDAALFAETPEERQRAVEAVADLQATVQTLRTELATAEARQDEIETKAGEERRQSREGYMGSLIGLAAIFLGKGVAGGTA